MTVQDFTLSYTGTEKTPGGVSNNTTGTFDATVTNTAGHVTGSWTYNGTYDVPGFTNGTGTISLSGTFTTNAQLSNGWNLNMLSADPDFLVANPSASLGLVGTGGYEIFDEWAFKVPVVNNQGKTVNEEFVVTGTVLPTLPPPEISVEKYTDYIHEGSTLGATVTLQRTGFATQQASTVDVTIADGSAVAGTNYTPLFTTETVTFKPGQTTMTLHVASIIDDLVQSGDKDFTVSLSNVTNGTLGTSTVADINILDAEGGPMVETANFLNERLTGGTGADTLTAGAGKDTLLGLGGDDTLVGGGGTSHAFMSGGAGDDTYIINLGVTTKGVLTFDGGISEGSSQGNDTVVLVGAQSISSYVTLAIPPNVENFDISQTGATLINLRGNAEPNILTGNDAANTLDGGAGAGTFDSLIGGLGNDTYIIHSASDVVTEAANAGNDTLLIEYNNANKLASDTVDLANYPNVENVTVKGTGLFDVNGDSNDNILTGNASANTLTGNGGNDTLDGGIGADHMIGGAGNDTYVVDNIGDVIVDGGGNNTVIDKMTGMYTLAAGLDTLIVSGPGVISAHGNDDGDMLTGGSGVNTLIGGAGSDTIEGGLSHDILTGGAGANTFVFTHAEAASAGNSDTITDFKAGAGGDVLDISDVLAGHMVNAANVDSFVHLASDGHGGVLVSVNASGAGTAFITFADLAGHSVGDFTDAANMLNNGNLIV